MYPVAHPMFAALVLLAVIVGFDSSEGERDSARPRMGHLARIADNQGNDLFRLYFGMYFEKIIAKDYGKYKLDKNDWRTYSPRSEECTKYLKSFIGSNYELINMQNFVLLDACLGYLYDDNEFKWSDQTSDAGKQTIEALINDENLRKIYSETQIETIDSNGASVLKSTFEMFFHLLNKDYYYITCDKSWISMLVKFADGRKYLGQHPEQDSYLRLLFSSVSRLGSKCFKQAAEKVSSDMQCNLRRAKMTSSGTNKISSNSEQQRQQLLADECPEKLMKVLQVVQGVQVNSVINLNRIQRLGVGLERADAQAKKRFLNNLSAYANGDNLESTTYNNNLPIRESSYDIMKNDLCKYYRSNNVIGDDTWAELVKMLRHQDFFGRLDEVLFYRENGNKVTTNKRAQRVRPVYMATFMCRYIDLTHANIDSTQGEPHYQIELASDASELMRDWPMGKHDDIIEYAEPVSDA